MAGSPKKWKNMATRIAWSKVRPMWKILEIIFWICDWIGLSEMLAIGDWLRYICGAFHSQCFEMMILSNWICLWGQTESNIVLHKFLWKLTQRKSWNRRCSAVWIQECTIHWFWKWIKWMRWIKIDEKDDEDYEKMKMLSCSDKSNLLIKSQEV